MPNENAALDRLTAAWIAASTAASELNESVRIARMALQTAQRRLDEAKAAESKAWSAVLEYRSGTGYAEQ